MTLTLVILFILVVLVAIVDYLVARRLNDGIGSWKRDR